MHERFGDEEVVRLVAVDRRLQHRRNRAAVNDERDQRGAIRAPAYVLLIGNREEEREERQLDNRESHDREVPVEIDVAREQCERGEQRPECGVGGVVASQRAAAKHRVRQQRERGEDEQRHRHLRGSSTDSI